jgi:hypothetical protein
MPIIGHALSSEENVTYGNVLRPLLYVKNWLSEFEGVMLMVSEPHVEPPAY